MKSQSYMTRALQARDPRFATILGKLGYDRRDVVAEAPKDGRKSKAATPTPPAATDALPALRRQYQEVVGKRPFNGWDAEILKAKIEEARAAK